ncbi:MAG: homoserine dehydrogenase [Syntrophobacterales bacterium]|nr:MAG: homoserine dehydrogenase [Syntrophobacterales bacterium]
MRGINVGLIGWGTVGSGVIKILQENGPLIEKRLGSKIVLKRVADIDLKTEREVKVNRGVLTDRADEVIADPEIDVVLELIGGEEPARSYILEAFKQGKHVVTANKALLATHLDELYQVAQQCNVDLNFEAAVGGGIPIIRTLKEGFVAERIETIFGILNGTSNYILSTMTNEGGRFTEVLRQAQAKGYAEVDPSLDIDGIDAAHKLAILIKLAFGAKVPFEDIFIEGISDITPLDIQFGREFGYKIKLLAIGKTDGEAIEARVHPTMLPSDHLLATVDGVFNAIFLRGNAVGETLFFGQGAGMMATGSAVVSDLIELSRNILKGTRKRVPILSFQGPSIREGKVKDIEDIVRPYYMRFSALDRPGVLSKISGVLGKNEISIASVIQKGRGVSEAVPVVMMTHEARERNVRKALREIDQMDVILNETMLIRVEDELSGLARGVEK